MVRGLIVCTVSAAAAALWLSASGCQLDLSTPFPTGMTGGVVDETGASATATTTEATATDTDTASVDGTGTSANGTSLNPDSGSGMGTGTDAGASGETSTGGGTIGTASDETTAGDAGVTECGGQPLSPLLATPPMCAPTCTAIGYGVDCPGIDICRLKDSQTAVCETCEPCGNLFAPCTESIQCDILFTCFMGQCTAMCDFNTPQTCGNPAACTDVGHPTHGVCDPNL